MNIFDLRMNGFSTETAVCLQTLHYSVLTGVANAFNNQMVHMINCSEVFTKSSAFQETILIHFVQICCIVLPKHFYFVGGGEMYCCSFTSGKTYLVIQTWRMTALLERRLLPLNMGKTTETDCNVYHDQQEARMTVP